MLSSDAAALAAERLTPLGVPVITFPSVYGENGVNDFHWYALNHPQGWLLIPRPVPIGTQGYVTQWLVTVDAAARTEADARILARRAQNALMHLSRQPTAFEFMGDTPAGTTADGFKYVLSFTAHLRQGDTTWL